MYAQKYTNLFDWCFQRCVAPVFGAPAILLYLSYQGLIATGSVPRGILVCKIAEAVKDSGGARYWCEKPLAYPNVPEERKIL